MYRIITTVFLLLAILSCNNPQAPTEIANEQWRISEPQTQNHADITLHLNDDGTITCTGNWYYEFFGYDITCTIMQGTVTKTEATLQFTCSGNAAYPPDSTGYVEASGFTLAMTGQFTGGSSSGEWSISFDDPEWDGWAPEGDFSGQRQSGSGITD